MSALPEKPTGILGIAYDKCSTTPAGDWFDGKHETTILGRVPKDDDDDLFHDQQFNAFAEVRPKGGYPELPRISFPSSYLKVDDPLPYPPHLIGRIGQSGWNHLDGVVTYAVIEFDLAEPGVHESTGISAEEMEQIKVAVAAIPCCEVNLSTSGRGLHVRIPLAEPLSVTARTQYGEVNRRALALIDDLHDLPFNLVDKVDNTALGRGVLWMWAHGMNERSFELVSEATESLDMGDWRPQEAKTKKQGEKRSNVGFDLRDFLERNGVPYDVKSYDNADDGCGYLITCPENHEKFSSAKTMLWVQDGKPCGHCMADKCKKKTGRDFLKLLAPNDPVAQRSPSQWSVYEVLYTAEKCDEFFHDSAGNAFVQFRFDDGPLETFEVASQKYRDCLRCRFRKRAGSVITEQNLSLAIAELQAHARLSCPQLDVNVRVAARGDKYYLDLCDEGRHAVEISAAEWKIVDQPAGVRFTRPAILSALPLPERGGSIELLRKYVHVGEQEWPLIPAWILAAMKPDAPCPGLALVGPGGSFKSNTVEMAISTFHPTAARPPKEFTLPAFPKSVDDLFVAAYNSWVVGIDNVSKIAQTYSDCLCCLITGAARTVRKLYSDTDVSTVSVRRPVVITSTKHCVTAADLTDRTIVIEVSRHNDLRRPELELWEDFRKDRPKILGALLDAFSAGLAGLNDVVLNDAPRMMDFAKFATAAETTFGFEPGTTVAAMNARQQQIAEDTVGGNEIAQAIVELAKRGGFEGDATSLMRQLELRPELKHSPRKFRNELMGLVADLSKMGVHVWSDPGRSNKTIWTVAATKNVPDEAEVAEASIGESHAKPAVLPDDIEELDWFPVYPTMVVL